MSKMHDLLKPYKNILQNDGYSFKNSLFYKIENDIAFCFSFSNISLIYCDYYFIPLYIPTPHRYLTYGNRLEILTGRAVRPCYPGNNFDDWMRSVNKVIDNEIIPFFDKISSPDKLLKLIYREDPAYDRFIAYSLCDKGILCIYTNLYLGRYRDANIIFSDLYDYLQHNNDDLWTNTQLKKLDEIQANLLQRNEEDISEYLKASVISTAKACGFAYKICQ